MTTQNFAYKSAEEYLAPRQKDWSEYREHAIAEGNKFLRNVDQILETVAKNAPESEKNGRVSDETVQAIEGTGLFRTFTPKQYGGLELTPAAFFEGIMRIAEHDSSAAWISGQINIHSFEIALMDPRMQEDFWGDNPDARASSSYAPIGKWEEKEDGYVLNGTWTFSSGVDHADWIILGGKDRNFVVPKKDVSVDHDSWDVQGLKGTGSKAVTLEDVFVPRYRTHHMIDTYNDQNLGWNVNNRPLYWMSFMTMFNATPVNTAIGTSIGGINAFVEQSRTRLTRQGTGAPASSNPFLHLKVAQSRSRMDMVKLNQLHKFREYFDTACNGKETSTEERMRMRFESAQAIHDSLEAFENLWPIAGAASSASENPMQQRMRDLHAARNHGSAGVELAAGLWARAIFELEVPPFSDFATLAFYK